MINLRICKNREEIIDTLCKMYVERTPVLTWQNQGEKRIIVQAEITKINFEKNYFEITANKNLAFSSFDQAYTFYMRGPLKSILFKRQKIKKGSNKICVQIPEEVRMYEQRAVPRLDLTAMANIESKVYKLMGDVPGNKKEFLFNTLNLSKNGMCLKLISTSSKYFYEGDTLYLARMEGTKKIINDLPGKIIYMRKSDIPGQARIQWDMGIKFDEEISEDVIEDVYRYAQKKKLNRAA